MPAMSRPSLPQVTLCAIDTRCPALALQALQRSMAQADFGRAVLFTHGFHRVAAPVEVIEIDPIRSGEEYSRFVLKALPPFISTDFALVTQWDGFVLHGDAWSDDFLRFDYVGAAWDDQPMPMSVGNGGFSLRSQRLLMAGLDPRIDQFHPEDVALCRTYRALLEREHGVRYAPVDVADRFAFENKPVGRTFGFHGPKNLQYVVDRATLSTWLAALPDDFYRGRDARRLMRSFIARSMGELAADVARRRVAVGRRDISTRVVSVMTPLLRHVERLR
jgi:hypothetical protein